MAPNAVTLADYQKLLHTKKGIIGEEKIPGSGYFSKNLTPNIFPQFCAIGSSGKGVCAVEAMENLVFSDLTSAKAKTRKDGIGGLVSFAIIFSIHFDAMLQ